MTANRKIFNVFEKRREYVKTVEDSVTHRQIDVPNNINTIRRNDRINWYYFNINTAVVEVVQLKYMSLNNLLSSTMCK